MKRILCYVLIFTFAATLFAYGDKEIYVRMVISGDFSDDIMESVTEKISSIKGVSIRNNDPDYTISVISNQVRWSDGSISTIVPISYIVKSSSGKIWHWMVIGNSNDLNIACSKIVDVINDSILEKQ